MGIVCRNITYRIRQNFQGGKFLRMHRSIAIRGENIRGCIEILQFVGKTFVDSC